MNKKKYALTLGFVLVCTFALHAEGTEGSTITEAMTTLVFQLGIVIFAVKAGGSLARGAGMPSVLGELLAGVIIGPFALGSIPLPGLPNGFFPIAGPDMAISPVLYGFSTVASIILLFSSGLETDLDMFLRYSVAGGIVGLGGVIFSYSLGAGIAALLLHTGFFSPSSMFLGIMCTATSVGITARILSDRKKMDSPEGVTILAAAVFDDVLGIVALAIVMGVVAAMTGHATGNLTTMGIAGIAVKAFGLWLGFTALGLVFGKKIATLLKRSGGASSFTLLAFGLALLLAGFFETQGLAMIIGAYIVGLSLSKTDLSFLIQEKMKPMYDFFVPVFFAVMGMLVDVRQIFSPSILAFGLIYTLFAILSKVFGCGLPSLFLGFNLKGAIRIGVGMVPRGEVALIIAGIGLSSGILEPSIFGVAILMTMITTLVAPPALGAVLSKGGQGTRLTVKGSNTEQIFFEFPSSEITDLVTDTLLRAFEREGFLVQIMNLSEGISHIRKDDISISLVKEETRLSLETAPEDVSFAKTTVHETLLELDSSFDRLKHSYDPENLRQNIDIDSGRRNSTFLEKLDKNCLTASLVSTKKEDAIAELVGLLDVAGKLLNKDIVLADVLERESKMSTGMQHGIALPHARTSGLAKPAIAIGVSHKGVDFTTLDGSTVHIIALIVSPAREEAPHMQMLAGLGAALGDDQVRERMMKARSGEELISLLEPRKA